MSRPLRSAVLYFDFVDPISYLLEREVSAAEAELDIEVTRIGVEISPPPHPLGEPGEAPWGPRWEEASRIVEHLDVSLHRPRLVPWSRKAHELMEHVAGTDPEVEPELRRTLLSTFFEEGRDIGRVDVLVGLARDLGLDETETKAVLDVDRHGEAVLAHRRAAVEAGLRAVPTIALDGRRLEGFHNRASLSTFLRGSS